MSLPPINFRRYFLFSFLFLAVALTTLMAINHHNYQGRAASFTSRVEFLTFLLKSAIKNYNTASASWKPRILAQINVWQKERRTLLLAEIKTNPSLFLSHATLAADALTLPPASAALFEKNISLDGYINKIDTDNFADGVASLAYNLPPYTLFFPSSQTVRLDGPAVVSGVGLDYNLAPAQVLYPSSSPPPSTGSSRSVQNSASGNQHTLVIPFYFIDDNSQPFASSAIHNAVFTGTGSVNSFLKENSYNNLSIYGETANWLNPGVSRVNCSAINPNTGLYYYQEWGNAADQAARAAGYNPDPSSYDRIIYLFPYQASCNFAGISWTNTDPSVVNNKIYLNGTIDNAVISHEVLHSLEFPNEFWKYVNHAYSLNCGNKAIDNYANCSEVSGQNLYDVMNTVIYQSQPVHNSSAFKANLGWLNYPRIQEISESGVYTLSPLALNTTSLQAITIAKPDPSRGAVEYYYIDYRMPSAGTFDDHQFLRDVDSQGVVIHLWTNNPNSNPKLRLRSPYLIDASPGDGSFTNASLKIGQTFTDNTNPNRLITITRQNNDGQGRAVLQITITQGSTPTPTPANTPTPIPTLTPTSTPTPTRTPTPTPTPAPPNCRNITISGERDDAGNLFINYTYVISVEYLGPITSAGLKITNTGASCDHVASTSFQVGGPGVYQFVWKAIEPMTNSFLNNGYTIECLAVGSSSSCQGSSICPLDGYNLCAGPNSSVSFNTIFKKPSPPPQ